MEKETTVDNVMEKIEFKPDLVASELSISSGVDVKGIDAKVEIEQKREEQEEFKKLADMVVKNNIDLNDTSDVFITEKDTFDIKFGYYKVGGDFCVESVDDEFDPKNPLVKTIEVTFKYPSQGDYEGIISRNEYKSPDKMTIIDVMQMELTRLVVLIRKWSIKAEFSKMVELDPKIVKAMTNKVREKIGVKGIL